MATLDKLRKCNIGDERLPQALKDWPSHPGAITRLETPLDPTRSSQGTVTGRGVPESEYHTYVHLGDTKKTMNAEGFWKDVFVSWRKKRRMEEEDN
jgi:hypothetical protein